DKELAKETARQEQEKYNLKKALELQKQLDERKEFKGDLAHYIDWSDPKSSKKQKLDEQAEVQVDSDQKEDEIKKYMKIVPGKEIAIDAIPLATKPPVIVDWKITSEGRISSYHIIRADGSSKR
nr:hypothetical protein [Tanacetum cinerariifolium]